MPVCHNSARSTAYVAQLRGSRAFNVPSPAYCTPGAPRARQRAASRPIAHPLYGTSFAQICSSGWRRRMRCASPFVSTITCTRAEIVPRLCRDRPEIASTISGRSMHLSGAISADSAMELISLRSRRDLGAPRRPLGRSCNSWCSSRSSTRRRRRRRTGRQPPHRPHASAPSVSPAGRARA